MSLQTRTRGFICTSIFTRAAPPLQRDCRNSCTKWCLSESHGESTCVVFALAMRFLPSLPLESGLNIRIHDIRNMFLRMFNVSIASLYGFSSRVNIFRIFVPTGNIFEILSRMISEACFWECLTSQLQEVCMDSVSGWRFTVCVPTGQHIWNRTFWIRLACHFAEIPSKGSSFTLIIPKWAHWMLQILAEI